MKNAMAETNPARSTIATAMFGTVFGLFFVTACTHKIEIIPSDKPIRIDLNVKIDQEIRVRLDKDVEDLLANNPDIF